MQHFVSSASCALFKRPQNVDSRNTGNAYLMRKS
jgi:hypothetical protein